MALSSPTIGVPAPVSTGTPADDEGSFASKTTGTFDVTNWLAQLTDVSGLPSPWQISSLTGRPLMPPILLLMNHSAAWAPYSLCGYAAVVPFEGACTPMTMGSPVRPPAPPDPLSPPELQPATASAIAATQVVKIVRIFMEWIPFEGVAESATSRDRSGRTVGPQAEGSVVRQGPVGLDGALGTCRGT